jgi:MSHA biogenesis protein MshQ
MDKFKKIYNIIDTSLSSVISSFVVLIFLIFFETSSAQAAITTGNNSSATNTSGPQPNTITYVGSGGRRNNANCGNPFSITPPVPGAVVANDLLIASVISRHQNATVTTPTGWTKFGEENTNGLKSFLFYRIAGSAPGIDATTFTGNGVNRSCGARMVAFRNVDTTNPLDPLTPAIAIPYDQTDLNVTEANSNDITTGTAATTEAAAMVIVSTYIDDNMRVNEVGFSQAFDNRVNTDEDYGHGLFYQLQTITGNKSVSWDIQGNNNERNIDYIYALKPSTTVASPSSLSISVPTGTTTGDVMIATVTIASNTTITADADWTMQNDITHSDNGSRQIVYSRVVDGTEPASYDWTFGTPVTDAVGGIITYSGVDTTDVFCVTCVSGNETSSGLTHTANEITTEDNNAKVISIHSFTSSENWLPPPGMSEHVDITSRTPSDSNGISLEMNDVTQGAAGLTGDKTATAGGSADTGISHLLALTPFIPTAPAVEYHMDGISWGTVTDSSGNGINGSIIDTGGGQAPEPAPHVATTPDPPLTLDPGTCGYGEFRQGNTDDRVKAVDTNFTPGNVGSISFWFANRTDWDTQGDRLLFDASEDHGGNGADKQFFLIRRDNSNGSLRFVIEDDADLDMEVQQNNLTFSGDEWVHIAVTWDLPNDEMQLYVNGVLRDTDNTNTSGTIGDIQSLYIGDNREPEDPGPGTTGVIGSGWTNDNARGYIDEFKIYNSVISSTQVNYDASVRHSCSSNPPDHYEISYAATPGVTCEATAVTIEAHDIGDTPIDVPGGTVLTITSFEDGTATNEGSWDNVTAGTGVLSGNPGNPVTYTWPSGTEESAVTLNLSQTTPLTIDIDLLDNSSTPASEKGDGDNSDAEDDPIEFRDAVFRFFAGGTVDTIGTQIAGKESNSAPGIQTLEIRSVETDPSTGVCGSRISGDQTIQMAFKCNNPTTCHASAPRVEINNTDSITPGNNNADTVDATNGNYNDVDLTFNASGQAPFTFDFTDVGQIQLYARMTIPASAPDPEYTLFGTSNMFVVKPFGFDVQVTGNPAATGPGGTKFIDAGDNFTVVTRAVAWNSVGDSDFNGVPDNHDDINPSNNADLSSTVTYPTTPNFGQEGSSEATDEDIDLNALLDQPGGGNDPGLVGETITTFTSGSGSNTTVNYDEVGIIEIRAEVATDQDYLGGGSVIGKSGYVGRFVPDRLVVVSDGTPAFANECSTGTAFTYMDQGFYYGTEPVLTLEARASDGTTVTGNYDDTDFMKLSLTDLDRNYADNSGVGGLVTVLDDATPPTPVATSDLDDYDGQVILTMNNGTDGDMFAYGRSALQAEFNADVSVTFTSNTGASNTDDLNDDDDVCVGDGSTCIDYNIASITGARMLFGRLAIGTAAGSELLPIQVPFQTEYYNGTAFEVNGDDGCTTIDDAVAVIGIPDLVLTNLIDGTQTDGTIQICAGGASTLSMVNATLVAGLGGLSFTAPGDSCVGYSDITLDLTTHGINYLQYDWLADDATFDDDPKGRVDFGIFEGSKSHIYIREPW